MTLIFTNFIEKYLLAASVSALVLITSIDLNKSTMVEFPFNGHIGFANLDIL